MIYLTIVSILSLMSFNFFSWSFISLTLFGMSISWIVVNCKYWRLICIILPYICSSWYLFLRSKYICFGSINLTGWSLLNSWISHSKDIRSSLITILYINNINTIILFKGLSLKSISRVLNRQQAYFNSQYVHARWIHQII